MAFKVLNRVPMQNAHRPAEIKETTVTIQDQSPFTQYTRTLDGDWTKDTDNAVIDAVLNQVFKDTFAGRYESEKVTNLENQVLKANEGQRETKEKVTELEKNLTKEVEKVNKLVETIIHAEDLTQAQKELILAQHPIYQIGQLYKPEEIINYDGELYEVVQEHVAQGDWRPDETPALYTPVKNTEYEDEDGNEVEVINDFVQPTGAHDAYQTGDKVRFNGKVFESTSDNNVYSPSDYPAWWQEIESE
jgi:hypothetical protein